MVPTKVEMKRPTLIQNCHGLTDGVEKFSGVISNRVAAPRSPTTAGRRPVKRLYTMGVFMYFKNMRLMMIISISEGSTRARVAMALPSMAMP